MRIVCVPIYRLDPINLVSYKNIVDYLTSCGNCKPRPSATRVPYSGSAL